MSPHRLVLACLDLAAPGCGGVARERNSYSVEGQRKQLIISTSMSLLPSLSSCKLYFSCTGLQERSSSHFMPTIETYVPICTK